MIKRKNTNSPLSLYTINIVIYTYDVKQGQSALWHGRPTDQSS